MSNGIKADYKSTIVMLFKSGSNATTKCVGEPDDLRRAYEAAVKLKDVWKVVTGDEDDSVAYIDIDQIAFLAIQNYLTEEEAQKRIKTKHELATAKVSTPNKIITPNGPRRM